MPKLTRRGFLGVAAAATTSRALPQLPKAPPARRILTLVYDHSKGMMRAVERVVR